MWELSINPSPAKYWVADGLIRPESPINQLFIKNNRYKHRKYYRFNTEPNR